MTPFIARLSRARHMQQYWDALIRGAPEDDLARLRAALDQPTLDLMEGIRTTQVTPAPDLAFLTRMENDVMDAFQRAHAQPVPIRSGITNRWPAQSGFDRTIPGRSLAMPRRRSMAAVAAFATVALVAITLAAFFFSMRGSDQPAFVPGTPVEVPTSTPAPAPTETVAPVTMYRGNLERTGEMPGPAPTDRPGVLWRAETGSVVKGPLAVGNGLVYTGTDDGSVHAFDMATGAAVWKLTGNTTIESPSIVLDGAIAYIAGYDGMVLAVDAATGTELWRTDPALNVSRRVAYDAATKSLYVGGLEAVSYAFDSATGQLKWQTDIQAPQASIASIVTADTLYFGIPDGLLYALNTADGTIRWTYDSTHDGFGSLTYANNTIFGPVGPAEDSAFVAVDATTGAERWQITSESAPYSAAAVVDGNLIIGTDLGDVMSVAQADGQVNWTFATGNASSFGGPASIVDDSVYAVDTGGWLYALDVATGQELWRVRLDEGINYSPAITGGVIYLGTWSGSVYALGTGGTDLDELAATPVAATPRASAANPNEVTTTFLWQAGGGDSALRRPDGIAAAPDGSIWVIDAVDHEVHILEGDGTTRQVIALDNAGAGSFNFTLPNGESYATIAVDADGNAYVLDNGNFRVVKFDASGQFIQELNYEDLADTAAYADDIAVGPDGSIYVKDSAGRRVLRLSANGELATVIGQPENVDERLAGPAPIGVDAAGNLYVSDNADDIAEVKVYAPDGTFLRRFGQGDLELAIDIAVDANGIAYVTDPPTNQIKMFDGDGELIGAIGEAGTEPGQFTGIGYLAVDATGNLYVVDFEGRQVEAFHLTLNTPAEEASSPAASESTPDTADASIAGVEVLWETTGGEGGFAGPTLLTIAPDGTIWVGDPGHNSFQIFDTDGTFIESWTGTGDGEFGMTEDDGDPFGAVAFAADGSFYVLDPGAREILAFSADRTFLSRFGGQGRGPGQFLQPMSIATDQAGNVAVSDFGRGDIQTFAQDGTLLSTARLQSTYPVGNSMVIDSDGNFIVLEFECCSGPAVVEKFDQEGNLLLQIGLEPGTGQLLGQPLGIGVDAAGNIYVTEIEPSRVLVYSPDGEYLTDFGDALDSTVVFPFPFDVAVDAEGGVYVTEPSRNMLVKLRLPESLFPATPTP